MRSAVISTLRPPATGDLRSRASAFGASRGFRRFFGVVVVIQGVHVLEHVIQLLQVYAFGVADDDALGVLGYIFQFNGTEEWLHLAFNATYLLALYLVAFGVTGLYFAGQVPGRALALCALYGAGLETWHLVEHAVIIGNVISNSGCPCPGIGDRALGVSDTVLHFVYNAVAYAGTLAPLPYLRRARRVQASAAR